MGNHAHCALKVHLQFKTFYSSNLQLLNIETLYHSVEVVAEKHCLSLIHRAMEIITFPETLYHRTWVNKYYTFRLLGLLPCLLHNCDCPPREAHTHGACEPLAEAVACWIWRSGCSFCRNSWRSASNERILSLHCSSKHCSKTCCERRKWHCLLLLLLYSYQVITWWIVFAAHHNFQLRTLHLRSPVMVPLIFVTWWYFHERDTWFGGATCINWCELCNRQIEAQLWANRQQLSLLHFFPHIQHPYMIRCILKITMMDSIGWCSNRYLWWVL